MAVHKVLGRMGGAHPGIPTFSLNKDTWLSPSTQPEVQGLNRNPTFDYAITLPHPKPDYGVTMPHPLGKMFFLLNRNRAMENGDHTAVEFVYQYLSNFAKQHGLNTKIVRDQLVAEYGAPASLLEQIRLKVVP
ncbi:hypothetical protein FRC00_005529 [Tulasnella sp. 408]|nr:hypothetical protein FRC00_005529 [Tulasnella sp. 408]